MPSYEIIWVHMGPGKGVDDVPQLNIHVPDSSDLLARVEQCAQELEMSPSSLARVILDVGLEPFVSAQRETRRRNREQRSEVAEALRQRFSGALPARRLPEEDAHDEVPQQAGAGRAQC